MTLLVLFLLLAAAAPAAAFYLTGSFLLAAAGATAACLLAVGLLDLVLFYAALIIIKLFRFKVVFIIVNFRVRLLTFIP